MCQMRNQTGATEKNIVFDLVVFDISILISIWFSRHYCHFRSALNYLRHFGMEAFFFFIFWLIHFTFYARNLLCGRFAIPLLVEFKIDPRRLKLDWRAMFIAFLGCNVAGDGSANSFCLPHRPMIMLFSPFETIVICEGDAYGRCCSTCESGSKRQKLIRNSIWWISIIILKIVL